VPESVFAATVVRLEAEILAGRLKPGTRLREEELSRLLGASRTPVREALRYLEREGLVIASPRRGAHVSPLSAKDVGDLYSLRARLTAFTAELAAVSIQDSELRELRRIVTAMAQAASRNDVRGYLELYVEFHEQLAVATRNDWIIRIIRVLTRAIRRYGFISLSLPDVMNESVQTHRRVVAALERRQPEPAGQMLSELISDVGKKVRAHLEAIGAYL
jgi:DNA-binding GntR family transcriptional regulator